MKQWREREDKKNPQNYINTAFPLSKKRKAQIISATCIWKLAFAVHAHLCTKAMHDTTSSLHRNIKVKVVQ